MRIGGAIFVLALGAILTFAVHVNNSHGFNVNTVGVILMIAGAIWLVAEVIYASSRRRTDVIHRTPTGTAHTTYAEPNDIARY
jgi:hypothetical protein